MKERRRKLREEGGANGKRQEMEGGRKKRNREKEAREKGKSR